MKYSKKYRFVLTFIFTLLFTFTVGGDVNAESITDNVVPKSNPDAEYLKYPINNYHLDIYINDSASERIQFWKWGKQVKDSMTANIFSILSIFWGLNIMFSFFIVDLVGQTFTLNVINDISDKLANAVQTMAGFNSSFKQNGIYGQLLTYFLICLVAWAVWIGYVKGQQSTMLGGLMKGLCILVFSMGFFANSDTVLKGLNSLSEGISTSVLNATQITVGQKDGVNAVTKQTYDILIFKPYLLLQYGTMDENMIGKERIDSLLKEEPFSDNRINVIDAEVKDNKNKVLPVESVGDRIAFIFLLYLINVPLWLVLLLVCGAILFFQIMFCLVILMAPVTLIMSIVPAWSSVGKRWIYEVFRTLLMKVSLSVLLTLTFWITSILYASSQKYGYLLTSILMVISFAGIFLYRNMIFNFVSAGGANTFGGANYDNALQGAKSLYKRVRRHSNVNLLREYQRSRDLLADHNRRLSRGNVTTNLLLQEDQENDVLEQRALSKVEIAATTSSGSDDTMKLANREAGSRDNESIFEPVERSSGNFETPDAPVNRPQTAEGIIYEPVERELGAIEPSYEAAQRSFSNNEPTDNSVSYELVERPTKVTTTQELTKELIKAASYPMKERTSEMVSSQETIHQPTPEIQTQQMLIKQERRPRSRSGRIKENDDSTAM